MHRVEHIGIAVKDLKEAVSVYSKLLGVEPYKEEQVETEKVIVSFFKTGDSKIELLESLDETGPIGRFIQKKGEGMHHIAFAVADIKEEMARLKNAGFTLLQETPKLGADNKLVCFVHPKDLNGVLIELCQDI